MNGCDFQVDWPVSCVQCSCIHAITVLLLQFYWQNSMSFQKQLAQVNAIIQFDRSIHWSFIFELFCILKCKYTVRLCISSRYYSWFENCAQSFAHSNKTFMVKAKAGLNDNHSIQLFIMWMAETICGSLCPNKMQ